ncbi:hypothetical protein [Ruegeria sp.]|uniref:hypothetical protein n=1 Tax=Ruegeria sp. TaxID=1879320 RepID=UPI003AFF635E
MNMGEEVSHLKAHVNTFYNNGALQRASEQPHLKTNQKPSQINKKVGSQVEARLAPLTPTPAQLTVLRSSGRISVFGPPSVHRTVQKVMDDLDAIYGRRVGLEIGVYFIDSDAAETFGLSTAGFRIGQTIALARDRAVVDYRLASTIAQSGVVAPIAITRQESYVKEVKVEHDKDGTSIDITPGEVEFGISVHALPRIIDDDRIQLFLTILQSELEDGDIPSVEYGDGRIGLPVLDKRIIQNQSILSPNEVLVLSGYEQNLSVSGQSGVGLFKAIGLGGNVNARSRKIRMVILVRPSIIPQRGRS